MSFFAKLEKKIGKFAIRNLPIKIAVVMAISYILWAFVPSFAYKLVFSPYAIMEQHQFWRLFTWVFSPPGELDFIGILMIFCLILFGQQIEQAMGTFMFNLYIFGAWFWNTVIMLGISIYYYVSGSMAGMLDMGIYAMYFFDYGLFLAFALMYSDAQVLFMFFLPIRAIWIAIIDMGLMAFEFIRTTPLNRGSIIAYLVNFFIFYLIMARGVGMRSSHSKAAEKRRKRDYDRRVENLSRRVNGEADRRHKAQQMGYPENITKHKCAICGRTERDGDDLEFRFCSKCNGNYEYCNEHLFTHEHVK